MDPALWELLRAEAGASGDRTVEAIIRLARPGIEIPGVRMVSRFGTIATCRIRARDVIAVRALSEVISVKAALRLSAGFESAAASPDLASLAGPGERATDVRRSPALGPTGAGVVVAAVDWGVDVDAAAFRWPDDPAAADVGHEAGATRLLSFWDQRDQAVGPRPDPYGYGTVHSREEIDRALQDPRPYERLGYHPAIADRSGRGSHGTRTVDIAAGNGQGGGPVGIAPDADLIFVHLADRNTGGLANFGDSVRLLEAVDFISRTAGTQSCVINISAGRICGPKDGTTLVERALDELLAATPGRFVVNSAGNYFGWRAHSCGTIAPGEVRSLTFAVAPTDITANEVEIWYDGADEFAVRIDPPGYTGSRPVRLGERSDLLIGGRVIGRVYHREHDPNNGDNHIVAYLDPVGRAGNWTVTLEARRVSSGRFHAWIERDDTCPGCQARFTHDDSNPATTIGSIATSHLPLIVGAYDGHDPARPIAAFSSAGPGRDGRCLLPNLVAPGVDVLTARSAPVGASGNPGLLTRGNGTSFAAPHVTGAVALCFEAAGNWLSAHEIRSLVLGSCDPVPDPGPGCRLGHGYLNIPRLIADTQQALAAPAAAPNVKEPTMNTDDIVLLAAAPAIAYREYLYRPCGQLARWIDDRFDVVARPGQSLGQPLQEGDVLLEVTLGRMTPGRCAILAARDLQLMAPRRRLAPGQLLLRPRARMQMSEPLPVEPTIAEEDTDPGRLISQGRVEDQITDALSCLRRPAQSGTPLEALDEQPPEEQFDPTAVPKDVADALGKQDWALALKLAIQAGWRDENVLTNLVFFARHHELAAQSLNRDDPNFKQLSSEWAKILDKEVWKAINSSAENRDLVVSGDEVADHHRSFFRGNSGKRLKKLVEDAAKEVGLNPGLLGTIMMAETRRPLSYLSSEKVSSYHIGCDDFYEARAAIQARVPAYNKIKWDRKQTPEEHLNDAKKNPRLVKTILFDSGPDGALATAVYLKFREVRLREIAAELGKNFDSLSIPTQFALTRMAMAAGTQGVTPYLKDALNGVDIFVREAIPVREYQTKRNATVRTAQAMHLSDWIFGVPVEPATRRTAHESEAWDEEREESNSGSRTGVAYVRWYQAALNSIDSAGLPVNGIADRLTRGAVRRFQQRSGLPVDGVVGPDTERALMQQGAPAPPGYTGPPITPPPATATFVLLLDEDRDGSVDGTPSRAAAWTWGKSGGGAIVLVNNDDDGVTTGPDNANTIIDAGNDTRDVVPLTIARTTPGAPLPGTQVELMVDRPDVLRIFSSRAAGGTEVIGPGTAASFRLPSLAPARFEFAMEALRYGGTGFSGEVRITLRVTAAGGGHTDSTAVVRVAPWLMPNHLTQAETVFVADAGSFNDAYRQRLRTLVTAAGCGLTELHATTDIWMQDCMEFGFASLPGAALRTVLRSPRIGALNTVARSLLKTDLGFAEVGHDLPITFNSGGNLECSPPVTSATGKHYPFGRIYYGPGKGPTDLIDPDLKEFLRRQLVQEPVEVDTQWLTVGHVDEILSFVPAPRAPKGFKMIIASTRVAYAILDALNAATPGAKILPGRTFLYDGHPDSPVEQTVSTFLGLHEDFLPELHDNIAAGLTYAPKPLRDYNADRQRDLDGVKATMKAALGLVDSDIIELPSLCMPNPRTPPLADALTGGMVNMLVINRHCIIPQPFGPQGGGPPAEDLFERDVRAKLTPLGLTVNFLDCWNEYHVRLGEVHCSTNTLRTAAPVRWWEFQP